MPSGEVRRVAHVDVETLSLDPARSRRDRGVDPHARPPPRRRRPGRAARAGDAPPHRRRAPARARPRRARACSSPSGSTRRSPRATGCPRWSSSRAARRCSAARASAPSRRPGRPSRTAAPQLIVLAPCGFDLERTVSEAGACPAMGARVVAVDGDAAYSRPGPRVAEGVAQLAHLLHPDDGRRAVAAVAPAAEPGDSSFLRCSRGDGPRGTGQPAGGAGGPHPHGSFRARHRRSRPAGSATPATGRACS